ncbi:MAG: TIR domain-containing protein [Acidimicrobiaceae bacterium]|nr:TIR domain-containing protein [Acidimicrobiaceae bacterium]
MSAIHNVFISHRHEDDHHIDNFKQLMEGKGVQIRDASITNDRPNQAHSPDYIKSKILAPNIRWAGKLVVLITPDTKNHEWVDWEIEYANKHDKQIIGVWAPGSAGCELPEQLETYADAVVGWNSERILAALNDERSFETSRGEPRQPQPVKRIGC